MQPSKEIVQARKTGLGLTLREMTWVGKVFYKSGMFSDTKDEAVAIVKIMAGQEMGLAPFESMTGINIIKGRPTLAAATIGAKIKASPKYDYRVKVATELKSQIDFYEIEKGKRTLIGSSTYTIEQAKEAGLLGKDNWKAYPEDMLFARNISRGARRHTPDVFSTPVYTAEELEEAPGGLGYVPSDGGHAQLTEPAKAINQPIEKVVEANLGGAGEITEPPEGDEVDELDESVVEDSKPIETASDEPEIIVEPLVPVDESFRELVLFDISELGLTNIEEKRLIKDATGKIVTKGMSDHEWRSLRSAVDILIEERTENTLDLDNESA